MINNTETQRTLPHIYTSGAIFFITFRLHNSIPSKVMAQIKEAKELKILEIIKNKQNSESQKWEIYQQEKYFFAQYDNALERYAQEDDILKIPEIAQIVADKMQLLDTQYYDLLAYCIMSNHVHLLMDSEGYEIGKEKQTVSYFMQLLKGGTAFQINQTLGRQGKLWQAESYDHIIRNEQELQNVVYYILNNPVKAGLVKHWKDWEFTYLNESKLSNLGIEVV